MVLHRIVHSTFDSIVLFALLDNPNKIIYHNRIFNAISNTSGDRQVNAKLCFDYFSENH